MRSKDLVQQELKDALALAFKSTDENAIAQAFSSFAEGIQQSVLDDVKVFQQTADVSILAKRGVHQLTAQENKFYQGVITAMKSDNPQQAFIGLDVAFPETIIDNVIEDIKAAHPLLAAITFTNTSTLTKFIVNKTGAQLAIWGALNSKITEELSGAIGSIDLTMCKLSAFMPIAKDMIAAGPTWVDAYVRATLSEAIALGSETAIVTGTGKDMPIGMDRYVADDVTITGGVYPKKTAIAISDLEVGTYGALLGVLSVGPNSKTRPVDEVILVCNPTDYFTKIMPATTIRGVDGRYVNDVFPFPTKVIQSSAISAGSAIIGLAKKYFMGIGAGGNGGKIDFSDEFKFLDDERVYLTKMYGNGRALDNNAFLLLDVVNMTPAQLKVVVTNYEQNLKALTVASIAGTAAGNTAVSVTETITTGNTYKYKTAATLTLPVFNQILTTGWATWNGTADITATTGHKIIVAEVNAANEVKACGIVAVTSKA